MTVSATFSVIGEVRITASVDKGVRTDTYGQTEGNAKNNPLREAKTQHLATLKPIVFNIASYAAWCINLNLRRPLRAPRSSSRGVAESRR